MDGDAQAGRVRSAAWSDEFQCGVAIGMVGDAWEPGVELACMTQDGPMRATLRERFWR